MTDIDARLSELGLTLPDAPAPAANYVPYVISGNLVFVSGQISQNKREFALRPVVGTCARPILGSKIQAEKKWVMY